MVTGTAGPRYVMGFNTTQLFLSIGYDGSGEVTYVDVARYCMTHGCDTSDVATALHVPLSEGIDREAFIAGLDATTIAAAGQDTMAAIVMAAVVPSGTAAAGCPGVAGEFLRCVSGVGCYKAKVQCDGDVDCADGSDEGADACRGLAGAAAGDADELDAAATPELAAAETPAPGDTAHDGTITVVAVCAAALFVVLAAVAAWRFGCKGGSSASEGAADGNAQVQGFSMKFANATFAASQGKPAAEDGELYEDTDTLGGQAPAYEEAGPGTAVAVAEHDYALADGDSSRQGAVANATYVDTTQDAPATTSASASASQPPYSADAIATAPQTEVQATYDLGHNETSNQTYDLGHAETGDQTYDLSNSDAPRGATKSVARYDYGSDDLSEEEI